MRPAKSSLGAQAILLVLSRGRSFDNRSTNKRFRLEYFWIGTLHGNRAWKGSYHFLEMISKSKHFKRNHAWNQHQISWKTSQKSTSRPPPLDICKWYSLSNIITTNPRNIKKKVFGSPENAFSEVRFSALILKALPECNLKPGFIARYLQRLTIRL